MLFKIYDCQQQQQQKTIGHAKKEESMAHIYMTKRSPYKLFLRKSR